MTGEGLERMNARCVRWAPTGEMALSDSVTDKIYFDEIELSQSKIDSYNNCPLAYFCQYDLGLSENERAEFDARNIGSFIHAILENFF